jgi:hypothetical protein
MYLTMESTTQAGLAPPSTSIVVDSSACTAPSSWVTEAIREVARTLDPAGTRAGNLTPSSAVAPDAFVRDNF